MIVVHICPDHTHSRFCSMDFDLENFISGGYFSLNGILMLKTVYKIFSHFSLINNNSEFCCE